MLLLSRECESGEKSDLAVTYRTGRGSRKRIRPAKPSSYGTEGLRFES